MPRTSTRITGLKRAGRSLLNALTGSVGEKVGSLLAARSQPHLPEGVDSGFQATIFALAQTFRAVLNVLVAADERLFAAHSTRVALRELRDRRVAQLASLIVSLRLHVGSQFATPRIEKLGFEVPIQHEADWLLRQAGRIGETFASSGFPSFLGQPKFAATSEFQSQVDLIGTVATELQETVDKYGGAQRVYDEVLVEKNQAFEEYREAYLHTARSFEAFCRLAGEQELAERIRPSLRRNDSTTEEPGGETQAEDADASRENDDEEVVETPTA